MPVPFSLLTHKPIYAYEDVNELDPQPNLGLDFAMFPLTENEQRLLTSNGIVPLKSNSWIIPKDIAFTSYNIFGIPFEYGHTVVQGNRINRKMKAIGIAIDRLEDDTSNHFHRFHGHVPDLEPFSTIEGWSGGPVYGFVPHPEGLRYYCVAVQSKWLQRTHEVWACPVEQFITIVVALLLQHHFISKAKAETVSP